MTEPSDEKKEKKKPLIEKGEIPKFLGTALGLNALSAATLGNTLSKARSPEGLAHFQQDIPLMQSMADAAESLDPHVSVHVHPLDPGFYHPHARMVTAPNMGAAAHELSHHEIHQMPIVGKTLVPSNVMGNLGGAITAVSRGVFGENKVNDYLPYLLQAPMLAHEIGANVLGYQKLKRHGATPEQLSRGRKDLLSSAVNYAVGLPLRGYLNDLATRPIARWRERKREAGEEKTSMHSRSGKTPLTIANLARKTHIAPGVKLAYPGSGESGYTGPMTSATFSSDAEHAGFMHGFAEELQKIANDLGEVNPLGEFSANPEAFEELFKQAGFLDALKGYGRNIASYARNAKDTLTGGGFAQQMRELGSSNPMSTSASAGKVVGNQQGPMRDLVGQRADAASLQASLNPASWGLPSQAPAMHPASSAWGLPFQSNSRAAQMGPGGRAPLFGAPSGPSPAPTV